MVSVVNIFFGFSYPTTVRPKKLSEPEYLMSRRIGGSILSIFEKPGGIFDELQPFRNKKNKNSMNFFIISYLSTQYMKLSLFL